MKRNNTDIFGNYNKFKQLVNDRKHTTQKIITLNVRKPNRNDINYSESEVKRTILVEVISLIIEAKVRNHKDFKQKEKEDKEIFRKEADRYLSGFINKDSIRFRKELREDYKLVRFSAIISKGSKIDLVKYVTGSTSNYFLNSLTKATVDFEIANHSPFNEYINNRVALVNDMAPGFDERKHYRYIETLKEHTNRPCIKWTHREKLTSML